LCIDDATIEKYKNNFDVSTKDPPSSMALPRALVSVSASFQIKVFARNIRAA
jgi:hypothetical protein